MTKILIVDDKPERYREFIEIAFQKGMQKNAFVFIRDVASATDSLRTEHYDVLVVDMCLPQNAWDNPTSSGGSNLFKIIREDPEIKFPRYIIGITAETEKNTEIDEIFEKNPWVLMRTQLGVAWESILYNLVEHSVKAALVEIQAGFGVDVCFISALKDPEFTALQIQCPDLKAPEPIDASAPCYRGSLKLADGSDASIVGAYCLRMGAVEAALLSAKLIAKYRPRMIIMVGICAGREDKVAYGDIIVGSPVWDYTLNSKIIGEPGKDKKTLPGPDYINIDRGLLSKIDIFANAKNFFDMIHSNWQGEKPRHAPSFVTAPSATGPAVVADPDVFKQIKELSHRDVKGIEMEAYGVYAAARMAANPKPMFLSIKSVCDYGDFLKDDKYQKYAAYTSASSAVEFIKIHYPSIKNDL